MPLTRAWAPKLLQAAWPWKTESREVASVSLPVKHWVRSPRHHQPWVSAKSVTGFWDIPSQVSPLQRVFMSVLGWQHLPICPASRHLGSQDGGTHCNVPAMNLTLGLQMEVTECCKFVLNSSLPTS